MAYNVTPVLIVKTLMARRNKLANHTFRSHNSSKLMTDNLLEDMPTTIQNRSSAIIIVQDVTGSVGFLRLSWASVTWILIAECWWPGDSCGLSRWHVFVPYLF